jgi:hypothetical protein
MPRLAAIWSLLLTTACVTHRMPARDSFRGDQELSTFANGFTAILSNWPAERVQGAAWERQRMRVIFELNWEAGGCIPEKRYRIVERRVTWAPSSANRNELVATFHYVGICIRNRGCLPPDDPIIRDDLAQRAMMLRRAGRPYYEGCRWIDAEIRRIRRQGPLRVVPPAAVGLH